MKIIPNNTAGGARTGTLSNLTVERINELLGFEPNVDDDPDKVNHSWGFTVDGSEFGVWDYKGSELQGRFSCCGSSKTLTKIFGEHYRSER